VVRRDGEVVANVADPSRPRVVVVDDTSDTWGHQRIAYLDEIGEFEVRAVTLVESGPVRGLLRVESAFGQSTLTEDFVMAAEGDALEWRVLLDWREPAKLLKLRVPTVLRDGVATHEVAYATIVRPQDGEEKPSQRWVDLTGRIEGLDGPAGVALLNDAKYGVDVRDASIGLTAVRSPIYAHHDPAEPMPGVRYRYQDIGFQRFTLALVPHAGPWESAGLARRAAELHLRPTTLPESPHPGDRPAVASFASLSAPEVVLGALKPAQDGSGDLIVRLVETTGAAVACRVDLAAWGTSFEVELRPWEVRTWRIGRDGRAVETDLLEDPLAIGNSAPRRTSRRTPDVDTPIDDPDRPEPVSI
jgi:alpha-mannosidase